MKLSIQKPMVPIKRISLLIVFLCLTGTIVKAQESSTSRHLDFIPQLADSLKKYYVFEDPANKMAEILRLNIENDKYDNIEYEELAGLIEKDLRAIVNDKHLSVFYGAPQRRTTDRNINRYDHGFGKVEKMENNIGYLEVTGFNEPSDELKTFLAVQMDKLRGSSAIIIDLRNNGGGSPFGVQLLASYFISYEPGKRLNTIVSRGFDMELKFDVIKELETDPITETPVYILTSDFTFSAGEGFAYMMQANKRALIVGETTGGGAHPVNFFALANGFVAKIPIARSVNPITGTNWEAVGVVPDIQVDEEAAMDTVKEHFSKK